MSQSKKAKAIQVRLNVILDQMEKLTLWYLREQIENQRVCVASVPSDF